MNAIEILTALAPGSGRRAVVLCDGTPPTNALLASCLDGADLFVCADRAGWPHDRLPRRPDMVVGDFDTLGVVPRGADGSTRWIHDPDQDTTDGEKALDRALEAGADTVLMLGATGGHLDHTLTNCALMERYAERLTIALVDDHGVTVRVPAGTTESWMLEAGTVFSLAAVGRPVKGVTVVGSRWPLIDADVEWGGPTTASNEVVDPPLSLRSGNGPLLVTVRQAGRAVAEA